MGIDNNTDNENRRFRRDLLDIYMSALQQVEGELAVSRWLKAQGGQACAVVAIGKAAPAMMCGAMQVLDEKLLQGLVITRKGYADSRLLRHSAVIQLESAHPVPDESSLVAGQYLLDFIDRQPRDRLLLFLLSGGASSLVEVLSPGVSLADLQRLNQWLLGSGLDIGGMNSLRCRISRIKGGGLLRHLQGRPGKVLLISDVPGDDPAIIGSGLLYPQKRRRALQVIPKWVSSLLVEEPVRGHTPLPHYLIATSAQAVAAAACRARALGYPVRADYPPLQGDAVEQGTAFGGLLCDAAPGVHILGGETTVLLPKCPGRGGRNQHLALAAAKVLAGQDGVLLLSVGTDGSDGSSGDAGALVDGQTWKRAADEGRNPELALQQADSGSILEVTGDLVHTGPTGTNVMDLLVGLRLPSS
ncbi:glycerate kinase type-2 family protein [Thiolapillus sp.]